MVTTPTPVRRSRWIRHCSRRGRTPPRPHPGRHHRQRAVRGYNSNVLRETEELLALLRSDRARIRCFLRDGPQKGWAITPSAAVRSFDSWTGFSQQRYSLTSAVRHLVDAFLAGSGRTVAHDGEDIGFDELRVLDRCFIGMRRKSDRPADGSHRRRVRDRAAQHGEDMLDTNSGAVVGPEIEFEPRPRNSWTPCCRATSRHGSSRHCWESAASENAARRTAMKAATDNATELEKSLSREANAARQAQITQEIIARSSVASKPWRTTDTRTTEESEETMTAAVTDSTAGAGFGNRRSRRPGHRARRRRRVPRAPSPDLFNALHAEITLRRSPRR